MKIYSLVQIICLLFSLSAIAPAQELNDDCVSKSNYDTLNNSFSGNVQQLGYSVSSDISTSTQQFKIYTKKEIKEQKNLIKNDPASSGEFKAYQAANSISWILIACSLGGTIYGLVNVSKYSKETDDEKADIYAQRTKAGLAVGAGCLLIEWPISSAGRKHLNKAFELYDKSHRQVSMEDVSLFYSSGELQIGFHFKF
jgi:hypothetical protein